MRLQRPDLPDGPHRRTVSADELAITGLAITEHATGKPANGELVGPVKPAVMWAARDVLGNGMPWAGDLASAGRDVSGGPWASAGDLARLDAGRAYVQPLGRPVDRRVHDLDVGVPATRGAAARVGEPLAEARPLAAHVADSSHGIAPLVWLRKTDAAPAPPGPAVEGYPTPGPRRELAPGAPARRRRPRRPAAYPLSPWRAWRNRCAAWWGARPRPGRRRRSACAPPATCCGTTRAAMSAEVS